MSKNECCQSEENIWLSSKKLIAKYYDSRRLQTPSPSSPMPLREELQVKFLNYVLLFRQKQEGLMRSSSRMQMIP